MISVLIQYSNYTQSFNIMKFHNNDKHILLPKYILKDVNVREKASLIPLKRFSSKSSERVDIMFTEPESSLKTNKEQMQLLFTLS